jgi:RsiW-degrading membrane proteinase PrsW (M82 family)
MSIAFTCDQCGKSFRVKDELAGKKAKCKCGHLLLVPQASQESEEDIFAIKEDPAQAPAPRRARPVAPVAIAPKPVATPRPVMTGGKPAWTPPAKAAVATAAEPSKSVQRIAYVVLLAAMIPLVWTTFVKNRIDPSDALDQTVAHHPEIEKSVLQWMETKGADEASLFRILPGHKLEGAFLAHDTWVHWLYAMISSAAFTALLLWIFPKSTESLGKMIAVGLFTATVGIFLLLGFQFVADATQGTWVRGHGIIVILFYIIKFIGFSYNAALDPDTNFVLSAIGFTFGVGLCEEIVKSLPVLLHYQTKAEWPWKTACLVGLISGVGFGVSEGIHYSSDFYNGVMGGDIYLVRFISCVALHAVWSGAAAVFIYRHQAEMQGVESIYAGIFMWMFMVCIPMVLHGLYDTLLKKDMDGWALLTAIVSVAWLVWQIEGAQKDFDEKEPALRARPVMA